MISYVKESRPFLPTHLGVRVAQYEANCGEEVALARPIPANDDIVFGRERLDDCLILVATSDGQKKSMREGDCLALPLEALDDDLLDIHLSEL